MSVDRVTLAQQWVKWWGLVITVKIPGSTKMMGNFLSLHFIIRFAISTPLTYLLHGAESF